MLDIKRIRQDLPAVAEKLKKKKYILDVAEFERLDAERKSAESEEQTLLTERKQASKKIGELVQSGISVDDA
ncbi:MAG: seryl-tRNA synthetase, partial [Pseudohongiellaceae bacterium]